MANQNSASDGKHFPLAEQEWLAALAGHKGVSAAVDPNAQRQAQHLRHYFAQRDAAEHASPLAIDSEVRMLAKLHREGVLAADSHHASLTKLQDAAASTLAGTLRQHLAAALDWLLPTGAAAAPRYALVAGVALAVTVVPTLVQQSGGALDDETYKSVPLVGLGTQLMLVGDPALQAQQLGAALQGAGISVQVASNGPGLLLQAHVPAPMRQSAQATVLQWGLVVPVDGALQVNIQPIGAQ